MWNKSIAIITIFGFFAGLIQIVNWHKRKVIKWEEEDKHRERLTLLIYELKVLSGQIPYKPDFNILPEEVINSILFKREESKKDIVITRKIIDDRFMGIMYKN